jgi:hypothetical protein
VTNIRLLWKCPFRLQRHSFITTLFLGPFDDVITKFYCICGQRYYPLDLKVRKNEVIAFKIVAHAMIISLAYYIINVCAILFVCLLSFHYPQDFNFYPIWGNLPRFPDP